MKYMEYVQYGPAKSPVNFGSGDIFWIPVGHKCRHTATAGLHVERGHCARLRLYWYNGQYVVYFP